MINAHPPNQTEEQNIGGDGSQESAGGVWGPFWMTVGVMSQ